jgi:hypothetical protein
MSLNSYVRCTRRGPLSGQGKAPKANYQSAGRPRNRLWTAPSLQAGRVCQADWSYTQQPASTFVGPVLASRANSRGLGPTSGHRDHWGQSGLCRV